MASLNNGHQYLLLINDTRGDVLTSHDYICIIIIGIIFSISFSVSASHDSDKSIVLYKNYDVELASNFDDYFSKDILIIDEQSNAFVEGESQPITNSSN